MASTLQIVGIFGAAIVLILCGLLALLVKQNKRTREVNEQITEMEEMLKDILEDFRQIRGRYKNEAPESGK